MSPTGSTISPFTNSILPDIISLSRRKPVQLFLNVNEYFVYMLANKYNNVLYIGVTNNIRRRVYEHKMKLFRGLTSEYNCTKLVWYEKLSDIHLAISREKQLKNWQRAWKNVLIEKDNPNWNDLAEKWFVKTFPLS